ncbi:MAG: CPBP family intramembrane glutamic endopeptidase [Bacteroidales bacterium]
MSNNFKFELPKLGESILIFCIIIIFGNLFGGIYVLLINGSESEFLIKFVPYIIEFLPVFIYIYYKAKHNINYPTSIKGSAYVKVNDPSFDKMNPILLFFLLLLAVTSYTLILDPLNIFMPLPEWFSKIMETVVTGNIWWTFLTVAIAAPLLEEFVCRGTILRGLLTHMSPTKAIIWSALFFGVMHLNPWQAIPAFFIGCFMGWIYYKTHCLWATIFIHFVNNGSTVLLSKFYPNMADKDNLLSLFPSTLFYVLAIILALAVFAIIIYFINKYINNKDFSPKYLDE